MRVEVKRSEWPRSRSVSAPSSVTKTSPCWKGLMVPGSTLIYGSSFSMVTRRPRDSRMAASEAAAMPLPREETTPPVTNTYLVIVNLHARGNRGGAGNLDYSPIKSGPGLWLPNRSLASACPGAFEQPVFRTALHPRQQALAHLFMIVVEPAPFGLGEQADVN